MALRSWRTSCALGRKLFTGFTCRSPTQNVRHINVTPRMQSAPAHATPEIKKTLVHMRFYKRVEDIPDFVSKELVSLAYDYYRVRFAMILMNVALVLSFLFYHQIRWLNRKAWREQTLETYKAHRRMEKKDQAS